MSERGGREEGRWGGWGLRGEERWGGGTAQRESLFLKIENFIRIAIRSRREEGLGRRAQQKQSPSEQRENKDLGILRPL